MEGKALPCCMEVRIMGLLCNVLRVKMLMIVPNLADMVWVLWFQLRRISWTMGRI